MKKRIDIDHMESNNGHEVVKMGKKVSSCHGYVWYECKACSWRTLEQRITYKSVIWDNDL